MICQVITLFLQFRLFAQIKKETGSILHGEIPLPRISCMVDNTVRFNKTKELCCQSISPVKQFLLL
ncbi:hypothetical protein CVD28_23725 [Bacillus sp. M6-12]|nr:hypothetical protein CVD28_23725 [Bacillus sp. M6-12]